MKKGLIILLVLVALAGAAAWYFVSYRMDSVIQSQIESAATQSFGSRVTVGAVKTDIQGGSLSISQVTVANPPGFNNKNAFTLNNIKAVVDYKTFDIKRVIIDKPEIIIEEMGGKTNFDKMLAEINESSSEPKSADGDSGEAKTEPTIVIHHFRMNESRAAFESKSMDKYTDLKVDAIELNDVRGTPSEVADIIAREVISEITKEAGIELLKAKASDKISEFFGKDKD